MRFAPGILLIVLSALTAFHSAYAQQGITLDPATGDYTITYFATDNNGNERLRQATFVPKTKIKPTIRSEFESDHMVRISVSDQGPGIPADRQAEIFDKFVRLERDMHGTVRGSGLGLAISRQLVEAMGGTMNVESSGIPGEGSTFTFTLPAAPAL